MGADHSLSKRGNKAPTKDMLDARQDFLRDIASSADPEDTVDISALDEFSELPLESDEDLGIETPEEEEW